jgi:hypothetical protein
MKVEPQRVVSRSKNLDGIGRDRSGRRDRGHGPAVRSKEAELAVRLSIYPVPVLVHRAVVPTTEQREVRECRRASVRPVADVMALAEREPAARKAAASIAVMERPP